ncbi:hypothetical protein MYX82_06585 [Acidobacteria bacterium AH-259-D05]|nr:hypothetical protein [Acidobacteria bacterium AH-259-D05]
MLIFCLLLLTAPTACIWKLWTDDTPLEERIFDVYGTVQSISPDELVIQTNKSQQLTFRMLPSSVRGGDFDSGVYVHVYYKLKADIKEVTMVVEKIG